MKNQKTILLVVPQHTGELDQNPGGQVTAANGLITYFLQQGYKVCVVNSIEKSFPTPRLSKKAMKSVRRAVVVLRQLSSKNIVGSVLFTGVGFGFVERIILCMLFRIFGIRCLLFFRNSEILSIKKTSLKAFFFNFLLKIPNHILVQGILLKKHLVSLGINTLHISVVRNWVPPDKKITKFKKEIQKNEPVRFIFVGWLVEAKGIKDIVEAINILIDEYNNFTFTFIGGGTLEEWLHQQHKLFGWGRRVEITGWENSTIINAFFHKSHVLVLPTYKEGFPNVIIEAFSNGLPAITTGVGAIPESLVDNKNGFLIPMKNAYAIADAMKKYMKNHKLISMHSQYALETISELHDFHNNCRIVKEILLNVNKTVLSSSKIRD